MRFLKCACDGENVFSGPLTQMAFRTYHADRINGGKAYEVEIYYKKGMIFCKALLRFEQKGDKVAARIRDFDYAPFKREYRFPMVTEETFEVVEDSYTAKYVLSIIRRAEADVKKVFYRLVKDAEAGQ